MSAWGDAGGEATPVEPRALLASFSGPGLWLGDDARILCETEKSSALQALLCPQGMWSELGHELIAAARTRHITTRRCIAPAAGKPYGSCAYDLTLMALPVGMTTQPDAWSYLVLARDASFERNLIEALVNSRALYRDLVECCGDFVWEVDMNDRFSFVSPGGAVGYLPEALNGAAPAGLALDPHEAEELTDFFAARDELTEKEVWVRSETGEPACLIASVRPILDEYGRVAGARGVARDVTAERRRARELNEQREDDALISALARAVQEELQPDDMLRAAAQVLMVSLDAAAAWVRPLERKPDAPDGNETASFATAVAIGIDLGDEFQAPDLDVLARDALDLAAQGRQEAENSAPTPIPTLAPNVAPTLDLGGMPSIWRKGAFLCLMTRHADMPNGMIVLLDAGHRAEEMLAHAASHIGNAIEQARQLRELARLSRTDELTGLLNRRAFIEKTEQALHALSGDQQAALFLIDLDNFKAINDTHGHAEGDALLRSLATLLQDMSSTSPGALCLPARLGGDEFALWLGGGSDALTSLAAENMLRRFELLAQTYAGDTQRPGLSIGVVRAAKGDSLPDLMASADAALYDVKRAGKGAWRMSERSAAMARVRVPS